MITSAALDHVSPAAGHPTGISGGSAGRLRASARAVHGELIKLVSVRSTGYLALLVALSLVGVGLVNAVGIVVHAGESGAEPAAVDPTGAATTGLGTALVVVAALGILAVTGDYATGTIKTTLSAVPRRSRLLVAKTTALVALVFPVALGSVLLTFVGAQVILAGAGLQISLWSPGVARALLGTALYLTVLAVLAAGLGWLLRSTAGALVAWFALWILPSLVVMLLPARIADRVGPYLPGNAGTAVTQVGEAGELAAWGGLGVFALYAALATVAALVTLVRRDA